jgi:hypothetical protein
MLEGKAQDFYYQHLSRQQLTYEDMVTKTRAYFHTPENHQLYLSEWRTTLLKDVIATNPDKDLQWCLESVVAKLQKLHQGLTHNYGSSEGSLAGQLISACQGVEACTSVLIRPASTSEGVASDLRSAVGIYTRCHPHPPRSYNAQSHQPYSTHPHSSRSDIPEDPGGDTFYTDRRYKMNDSFRPRGNYDSRKPRGGYRGSYKPRNHRDKRYYVCDKLGCWSTRHQPDERKNAFQRFQATAHDTSASRDYGSFLAEFEGVDTGVDDDMDENDDAWDALIDASDTFFTDHDVPHQFLTTCGPIDGKLTTTILNNIATAHGVTGSDPYETQAPKELPHLFTFASRYDGDTFQGIMPDTGAAGISTAGELQALALKKIFPESTIDTFTAGRYKVKFGDNHEISSLGTIGVETPFGTIHFEVMPTNTPFLLCLADMDRHGLYLNNINNTLVHNGNTPR